MIAIGFGLVSGSLWVWLLIVAYFVLVYIPVIKYEEMILREKFQEYPAYADNVPAFYPGFRHIQLRLLNFLSGKHGEIANTTQC